MRVDNTLHKAWTNKKRFLKHLKFFGCDAYIHVPKEKKWIIKLKTISVLTIKML